MKKTFKVQFPIAQAYIQTPMSYGTVQEPMMDFAGQEVTITVESAEPEKPKVQMCGSYLDDDFDKDCDKPAQWEIVDDGHKHYRCNEHIWRILHGFRKQYTISPIPPEPPAPVVVEGICDNRPGFCMQGAKGTPWYEFPVPPGLTGKRFKYRLEEIPD